jgi:hypothetical protein
MRPFNTIATLAFAVYTVTMLGACAKTDNGSSPAAATPAATTCTVGTDGVSRDQYGRACNQTGVTTSCYGYQYINGQYYNQYNQVVNCGGNQNLIPPTGYYGGGYVSSCQQWEQYYGVQYVPVNMGGQLMCVRWDYMYSTYGSTFSQYGGYSDPYYWYQYPPSVYEGSYYDYYGYYSGGMSNISFGYSDENFSLGISLWFQ